MMQTFKLTVEGINVIDIDKIISALKSIETNHSFNIEETNRKVVNEPYYTT